MGFRKKYILIGRRKLFLEYLIEDWVSVATLSKSCCPVKLQSLSKILDGATLGNTFKKIRFFIPFQVFFQSFILFCKEDLSFKD